MGVPSQMNLLAALFHLDPERVRARVADPAVDPVGGDDQVVIAPACRIGIALGFIVEPHPQLPGARRQQVEQGLRPMPMKPCPEEDQAGAADMDCNIVPMGEAVGNRGARHRIVGHQIVDRLVGKDDTPAKGHAARIAFEQVDDMGGVAQLHREREIESRGSAADAGNLHRHGLAATTPGTQSPPAEFDQRPRRCAWHHARLNSPRLAFERPARLPSR